MAKINWFVLSVLFTAIGWSQSVKISGQIVSELDDDVENIHVINKTQNLFTITNAIGEFTIVVALNDVVQFSSIQFKKQDVIINQSHLNSGKLKVTLVSNVNALDTVVLGRILTGDLLSDINNTEGKPDINFYNLGIPGYTGKQKTYAQRELQEASDLTPRLGGSLNGVGGSIGIIPIINAITGRTKKLKNKVAIEANAMCMNKYRVLFSEDLLTTNPLPEHRVMEFFYFATETEKFKTLCKLQNDLEIFDYLTQKLIEYKAKLANSKN
ncbi:hypothetical protein [Lacinutrix salivirga]